ncbi:MAG: hypothetical protein ACKOKF_11170 [Bacteroidota bacterium]
MEFHRLLRDYVNFGCHNAGDYPWSLFSGSYVFRKNAKKVQKAFSDYRQGVTSEFRELHFPCYDGDNPHLLGLKEHLLPVSGHLLSVLLHGSQADGRVTGYSDVDALVILRDSIFDDPESLVKVARQLCLAKKYMYRIDPLQHHGWFVLTERDLSCFPEAVLPLEALAEARRLTGEAHLRIRIAEKKSSIYEAEAVRVLDRLTRIVLDKRFPRNHFALKSILSECMMLPVLYLQARDSKGYSKRVSFIDAKKDFSAEDWSVIGELSAIRAGWSLHLSWPASFILQHPEPWADKLRKYWPTPIPARLRNQIDDGFYRRLLKLIDAMKQRLAT